MTATRVSLAAAAALCAALVGGCTNSDPNWDPFPPEGVIVGKRDIQPHVVAYVDKRRCVLTNADGYCVDFTTPRISPHSEWAIPLQRERCLAFDVRTGDGAVEETCVDPVEWRCYRLGDVYAPKGGGCPTRGKPLGQTSTTATTGRR